MKKTAFYNFRKSCFETYNGTKSTASKIYDALMTLCILLTLIPLVTKKTMFDHVPFDLAITGIFLLDYLLRFLNADLKLHKGKWSYLLYPFTPMALVDLLSILSLLPLPLLTKLPVYLPRILRTARLCRIFKLLRYAKSLQIIADVIKAQGKYLVAVAGLAIGYILLCALIIFNVEPQTFDNYFDAIYWATVSLTTIGYGDLYPVTDAGRLITIVSALAGVAIVALPAGIITAGYLEVLQKKTSNPQDDTR